MTVSSFLYRQLTCLTCPDLFWLWGGDLITRWLHQCLPYWFSHSLGVWLVDINTSLSSVLGCAALWPEWPLVDRLSFKAHVNMHKCCMWLTCCAPHWHIKILISWKFLLVNSCQRKCWLLTIHVVLHVINTTFNIKLDISICPRRKLILSSYTVVLCVRACACVWDFFISRPELCQVSWI